MFQQKAQEGAKFNLSVTAPLRLAEHGLVNARSAISYISRGVLATLQRHQQTSFFLTARKILLGNTKGTSTARGEGISQGEEEASERIRGDSVRHLRHCRDVFTFSGRQGMKLRTGHAWAEFAAFPPPLLVA